MKRIHIFFSLILCLSVNMAHAQSMVTINPELRLVNEDQCNGYVSLVQLPISKVNQYLKKRLNQYGKNEGKKGVLVYRNAKVVGMHDLVTVYAQTDRGKKETAEVWLGILTDDKQSHQEAEKMLYDIVVMMYQAEADKDVDAAQKEYDRAIAKGISLNTKYQDNRNHKLKLEANLDKNSHSHLKLLQHIEKNKVEEQRLKEALNNTLANSTDEAVIKKAQKHYDKAVDKGETLARKLSNNEANKLKLQENLRKNAVEKRELEVEIAQNQNDQTQLKATLEAAKKVRASIK
ncbi:MAG: hypothetical protein ACPGJS_22470 [Flammeovirgaceae bacterium]